MSDIIDRLRALLERATNNTNEHEAETSLAIARKIAAQHAIELEAIALTDGAEAEPQIARTSDVVLGTFRLRQYRWDLACHVARAHGCVQWARETYRVSFFPSYPLPFFDEPLVNLADAIGQGTTAVRQADGTLLITTLFAPRHSRDVVKELVRRFTGTWAKDVEVEQTLVMIGKRSLAEAAIYVYRYLVGEVDRLAKERGKGRGRTVINSLRMGLVRGLGNRLAEEEQRALEAAKDEEEGKETSLVLVRATTEARRFLEDSFGSDPFTATRSSASLDYEAYREGVRGADDIEIPDPSGQRRGLTSGRALPAVTADRGDHG